MGGKTSQSSQTIQIPPEVLARYNAVNARASGVADRSFQKYSTDPNAFVQGLSDTQKAGISNINAASGAASPYFSQATTYGQNAATAIRPEDLQTDKFMSPYLQNVLGSTSALLNQQNQQAMAGQTGNAIRSGAFGGDRAGIAAANLTQQQNLASGKILSDIANQGYGQALQAAMGTAQGNRAAQLAASQQMASLGLGAQGAALQGAQAQLGAGQLEQQTGQAGKTALYNQFMQEQSYPFQVAQFLANIAEGTGALSGSTTITEQPGGMLMSDERLKEDVHEIGKTFDGQPIYKYKYKGDPRSQIGLIAQDVEQHHPHAVGLIGGYKAVDYDAATKDAEHKGHFASGGLVPESMGGHVTPEHMGEGFADGGSPVLPGLSSSDISALLAAQAKMFGPFSGEGMDISGQPHGGAQGYVPQASLPVAGLATASGGLDAPQSALSESADIAQSVETLADAYDRFKPKKTSTEETTKNQGGLAGYADGGFAEEDQDKIAQPKPAMPEAGLGAMPTGAAKAPNEGQSKLDIPNEQKAPQLAVAGGNLPKARTGMDDIKDIASIGADIAAIAAVAHGGYIKHRNHFADGGMPYSPQGGLSIPTGAGEHHELLTAKGPSSSGGSDLANLAQLGLAGAMIFGGGGEGAAAAAPKAGGGLASSRHGYALDGGVDPEADLAEQLRKRQEEASAVPEQADQPSRPSDVQASAIDAAPVGAGLAPSEIQRVNEATPNKNTGLVAAPAPAPIAEEPAKKEGLAGIETSKIPTPIEGVTSLGGTNYSVEGEDPFSTGSGEAGKIFLPSKQNIPTPTPVSEYSADKKLTSPKAIGEEVPWYKTREGIASILSGIGTMATAPTRNFGVALASGLSAGAKTYGNLYPTMKNLSYRQQEIAVQRAQVETQRLQAALNVAGTRFEERSTPEGTMYWDKFKQQAISADQFADEYKSMLKASGVDWAALERNYAIQNPDAPVVSNFADMILGNAQKTGQVPVDHKGTVSPTTQGAGTSGEAVSAAPTTGTSAQAAAPTTDAGTEQRVSNAAYRPTIDLTRASEYDIRQDALRNTDWSGVPDAQNPVKLMREYKSLNDTASRYGVTPEQRLQYQELAAAKKKQADDILDQAASSNLEARNRMIAARKANAEANTSTLQELNANYPQRQQNLMTINRMIQLLSEFNSGFYAGDMASLKSRASALGLASPEAEDSLNAFQEFSKDAASLMKTFGTITDSRLRDEFAATMESMPDTQKNFGSNREILGQMKAFVLKANAYNSELGKWIKNNPDGDYINEFNADFERNHNLEDIKKKVLLDMPPNKKDDIPRPPYAAGQVYNIPGHPPMYFTGKYIPKTVNGQTIQDPEFRPFIDGVRK